MSTMDPDGERARQARQADALARLHAADPGALEKSIQAAKGEPSPAAVHRAAILKAYPHLRSLLDGFEPSLEVLTGLAELTAEFRPGGHYEQRQRQARRARLERILTAYLSAPPKVQRQCEVLLLGRATEPPTWRRSLWSRLFFFWRC